MPLTTFTTFAGMNMMMTSQKVGTSVSTGATGATGATGSSNNSITPSALSGLQLWLDASYTSSLSLNFNQVTQWSDRSGMNAHATSAYNTCTYSSTALDGLFPGVTFSTSGLQSTIASGTFISGMTFFIVYNVKAQPYSSVWYLPANNDIISRTADIQNNIPQPFDVYGSTRGFGHNGTNVFLNSSYSFNNVTSRSIYTVVVNASGISAVWTEYVNGAQVYSTTSTDFVDSSSSSYLSNRIYLGTRGNYDANSVISEVVIYNKTLGVSDVSGLTNYLANKWQVSISGIYPPAAGPT